MLTSTSQIPNLLIFIKGLRIQYLQHWVVKTLLGLLDSVEAIPTEVPNVPWLNLKCGDL